MFLKVLYYGLLIPTDKIIIIINKHTNKKIAIQFVFTFTQDKTYCFTCHWLQHVSIDRIISNYSVDYWKLNDLFSLSWNKSLNKIIYTLLTAFQVNK